MLFSFPRLRGRSVPKCAVCVSKVIHTLSWWRIPGSFPSTKPNTFVIKLPYLDQDVEQDSDIKNYSLQTKEICDHEGLLCQLHYWEQCTWSDMRSTTKFTQSSIGIMHTCRYLVTTIYCVKDLNQYQKILQTILLYFKIIVDILKE